MNDGGDFFASDEKIDATAGEEEAFDAPVPTVTGEDLEGCKDIFIAPDLSCSSSSFGISLLQAFFRNVTASIFESLILLFNHKLHYTTHFS